MTDEPIQDRAAQQLPEEAELSLEERLADAEARAEEYLALAQRTQADFENYRKRALRDQESLAARAHERVVKELLPILDDLERTLEAAQAHEEAKLEEAARPPVRDSGPREEARGNREAPPSEHDRFELLQAGVALVHRALADLLAREGLAEIETEGAFDPHVHEALLAQPAEDAESGHVLQVLQKGYRLGDRLVRPARVIVAE